jgi:hypothetical protein
LALVKLVCTPPMRQKWRMFYLRSLAEKTLETNLCILYLQCGHGHEATHTLDVMNGPNISVTG